MDWKAKFKIDIKNKLNMAILEFDKYKSTGYIIHLQQAGNKLFSITENYLMIKYNHRVKSMQEMRILIENNQDDRRLLTQANQLHRFFYNADLQMSQEEAVDMFMIVKNKLNKRLAT